MLSLLLWVAVGLWVLVLIQLALNMTLVPDLRVVEAEGYDDPPLVSIVVPARNEEGGIRRAVTSFCTQDYPALEVVVVDDGSTDRTPAILADLEREHANLKVVRAADPPSGWLGKVNALETGRRHAAGEWLLFVDADVVYDPRLVRHAMALARREHADMVVVGPHFDSGGAFEACIMSSIYVVAAGLLPLYLVSRTSSRLLSAGGGVFNLVRRGALESAGAFASLSDAVVDDVTLGIKVKAAGGRVVPAWAGPWVRVRMYQGARDAIRGFTKNIYPAMARVSRWLLMVPFGLGGLLSLLPYLGLGVGLAKGEASLPAILSLVLMHLSLALIALFFGQTWAIVFLNPVRELAWWWIVIRSAVQYHRGGIQWRGRSYPAGE